MTANKYSKITLIPKDEEEVRRFKTFRNEDVFYMFKIICGLALFELVATSLHFSYQLATGTFTSLKLFNLLY